MPDRAASGPSRAAAAARTIVWGTGFVALWAYVARWARTFDPSIPARIPPALRPAGYALAGAGALLAAACLATFVAAGRGTPAPFDPPRAFVAVGPYRYVRNPMYIGAAALLAGAGLIAASPGIVLLAAAFLAVMHLFVVLYEERALERSFGETYLRYKAAVRRWTPGRPFAGR